MKKIMLFVLGALLIAPAVFAEGSAEGAEGQAEVNEISWYFKEGNAQVTDDWYAVQKIEEDLGIHFTHISPGGSDYLTRLQLLLASREVPNIITSYPELSANLIKWGVVQPVNKYVIDEAGTYIPNLVKNSLNWDAGVKMMTRADGNIYGVPCTNNTNLTTSQWIRMDWLDNLGLDVPTTMDEFVAVLRAFTFDDPDGNGKDDTKGTMMNEHWGARIYAVPFAAVPGNYYPYGDGFTLGQYHPRHKEYLGFLRDLIGEGLIDPELPTLRWDEVNERLVGGKFGFGWGWFNNRAEAKMREIEPNAVWEPMAPWQGPAYDRGYYDAGGVIRERYVVSSQNTEEDLDDVMALFNWLIDDQTTDKAYPSFEGSYWTAANGKRGEWWDVRPDGKVDFGQWPTPESKALKSTKEGVHTGGMKRFRSRFDIAWFLAQPERFAAQNLKLQSFPNVNSIPKDDPSRMIRSGEVALPDELNEQLGAFTAEQDIAWETMFYEVVLGVKDLDDSWNAWMAQAKAAGGEALMAAVSAEMIKAGL
jgi:putative aldouronate transport system substrate-binding protein